METINISNTKDSKYSWTKIYPIKYYEMDFNKILKPSSLMNLMQDMATIHAEMLGFGYSFTYPKNYGWFLIKYHMEFDDYPQDIDEIFIKTESRGCAKILAFRDFEFWTADITKRLGRATSQWMMVDLNTKDVLSFAKVAPHLSSFSKRESDLQFEKICLLKSINYEKIFEIRFDDIDVNKHVNNANYITWAFETIPYKFRNKNKLKTLDIVYKKEVAFGHKIISSLELNEETKTTVHSLKNETTNEDLCLICAKWI